MAERLRRDPLPPQWSFGVKSDGRIFFINEETRTTTWLHPLTGKAMATGHSDRDDLPPGWQEGITREGATYYMNHHTGDTSFHHPITHYAEAEEDFTLIERAPNTPPYQRSQLAPLVMSEPTGNSSYDDRSSYPTSPSSPNTPTTPSSSERPSFRKKVVSKGSTPSLKRRRDAAITMEGWLYKQDSGALKVWRKRWCVLADFGLFFYKGSDKSKSETGSILIPSYVVGPVGPQDKITRKFAFKCEHDNMRTYYLAAENQSDMNQWMRALNLAAKLQLDGQHERPRYDEDDAGFKDYQSRALNNSKRDEDDWLFRSPKDLNDTIPDDFNDDRTPQQQANGFDPNGRLPREPDELERKHPNNEEDYNNAPEGYWEARERFNQGGWPEEMKKGRDGDSNPPAIYDYPPDEDIDGYSSLEEGKQHLKDRYYDDDPRSKSDSDDQQKEVINQHRRDQNDNYNKGNARNAGQPGEDRHDGYNSLSESDQDRQIVAEKEIVVNTSAPVENSEYEERPRSAQPRQGSRPTGQDENRRQGQNRPRTRDSESSRASQDRHSDRPSDRHADGHGDRPSDMQSGDQRRSWDRESGSLSSGGKARSRSMGRERSAPHSPGQYPDSYKTLPRPRSKSRERRDTDNSQSGRPGDHSNRGNYDSSTTDSLPSPFGNPVMSPWGDGRRPDQPQRGQRPQDYDSWSESNRSQDRDDRRRDATRSLDRSQRSPYPSSMESSPRGPHQAATLPPDYRKPRGQDRLSTPTGSTHGSVDGRQSQPRSDPRRSDPRGDPRQNGQGGDPRRSDPRGDPRRSDSRQSNPRSDPRRSDPRDDPRRNYPRGDPRHGDPRDDPRRSDSRRSDPRRSDPRGDPRRSVPGGNGRRDVRSDPRRRSDPQRIDPNRVGPHDDKRVEVESTQGRRPPEALHFKIPKNGIMEQDGVTPEQRSILQSPLVQPNHDLLTPEQRSDLNSPMVYQKNETEWPSNVPESYYKAKDKQSESERHTPVQRSIDPQSDYIPQPVEAVIQRSTPTNPTFNAPSPNPNQQRASHYDHPRRYASPITEEETGGGVTEADMAPSRPKNGRPKSRSNRNTLEKNEYNGGDMLAPLTEGNGPSKGPREPTSRFRKWQMKTQPYILLSTGIRLRLSIAAGDLLGKSHEELVLLLIQLRRDQSNLERWLDMIDQELALLIDPTTPPGSPSKIRARHGDSLHRRSNPNLNEERQFYEELEIEQEEVQRELEISGPLVHLVDNLVRMGSLYGGENHMIAREFYKDKVQKDLDHIQPKKLIEFSRRLEEEKLNRDLKGELQQIQTAEDKLLEIVYFIQEKEKLNHLYILDKKLQEMSAHVSILKEDKDRLETSLERLGRQMDKYWDEPEAVAEMGYEQHRLERDLVKVRTQLAVGTKELEEVAAENGKMELEVTLLRSKLEGRHNRSPKNLDGISTKERLQMETEVTRVQSLMDSLDKQRHLLVNQMQNLKFGSPEVVSEKIPRHRHEHSPRTPKQYTVTDLDTMMSHDINTSSATLATPGDNSSKLAPPIRRRGDSFNKVQQIKEQQVQQSPVLESAISSTNQSTYHASPQILHPQPRYQQPPPQQMELSPNRDNQYYSRPSTESPRGDPLSHDRVRNGSAQPLGNRSDKRNTVGGHGKRPKSSKDSKYHTISRSGEVIVGSPMRRSRSVPDRKGLTPDNDNQKLSAMDRLMPGSPRKNSNNDSNHGAFSDTEAEPVLKPKKKSLRVSEGSQPKTRSPSLRHIRSARSQTLPGRFTNQSPQTLPVRPRLTSDLTNSGNRGTNSKQQQQQRARRHTFSGNPLGPQTGPFKGVQDDIAIHEFEAAMTVTENEYEDYARTEPSQPVTSDVVRGDYKSVEVDESTGGGLILGMPAKILIPERYISEEDEEELTLSPEEKERQEKRVDRITKMLSAHRLSDTEAPNDSGNQSLQDWRPSEILSDWDQSQGHHESTELRSKLEEERQARKEVLAMRRALAQEVKEQSKVMAARSMKISTGTPPQQVSLAR
ncbi:uncharacterized protein LOC117305192 isoform X5 [Asterias rubens]|uniref:uncharacterized protein LOC117305192 isoform X5 n=1 Tax=Asterias rubens TaxID=7604 RepID=UPI0014553285|nr:uncharacterized protein LOC117305192 isoform X5 [Asterias rubens]